MKHTAGYRKSIDYTLRNFINKCTDNGRPKQCTAEYQQEISNKEQNGAAPESAVNSFIITIFCCLICLMYEVAIGSSTKNTYQLS